MSNLNELQPGQQSASSNNSKPLWAAVGILGVAVLGMGGMMIYNQRPVAPPAIVAAIPATLPALSAPAASASAADDLIEAPVVVAPPAPVQVKKVVKHVPKPQPVQEIYAPVAQAAPYVAPAQYPVQQVQPVQVVVCHLCGTIESVTPVTRSTKPEGPGMGSVAGGLLGAVLGNQVGHGGGRAAATILGAVGGGFAGNAIEGNMHKETVYSVSVRMDDGSRRVLELPQPPQVGRQVTVEGSTMRDR